MLTDIMAPPSAAVSDCKLHLNYVAGILLLFLSASIEMDKINPGTGS